MEVYETEQEQIEAIKKWWKQNGKAVITGLILGLACLVGWQQWQASTQTARETASLEYSILLNELQAESYDAVRERASRILSLYGGTPYAAMAAMAAAKVNVETGELSAARTHLQLVIDTSKQEELVYVARARLARLMIDDGQASAAITLLKGVAAPAFDALYQEIIGDAYVAQDDSEQARAAYSAALASLDEGEDSSILQMKLDELGVEAQL